MVTCIMQNTNDIIHDIETTCECVLFPQKGYIFMHELAAGDNSKSTKTLLECKRSLILECLGIYESHRERMGYNKEIDC